MGDLGWAPDEVDRMEIWQVASFLGVSGDPVIRGARTLSKRSDSDRTASSGTSGLPPPRYEKPDPETWGNDPRTWETIDRMI